MAAAYIAGIAAGLLAAKPDAKPDEIKNALLATAKPLAPGQAHRCRTGIVRPGAAFKYLLNGDSRPLDSESFGRPLFLKQPYIDKRLLNRYKKAKADERIESIVIARKNAGQSAPDGTKKLIKEAGKKSGFEPDSVKFFKNADMAYIQAGRYFYAELLKLPDLFACGAADVSIFEMGLKQVG